MNLALVGEGEDTGLVLFRETFCRAATKMTDITILPLLADDLPACLDLSSTPVCSIHRVGLGAGVVGEAFVGEGEDASLTLDSPAVAMCVSYQGQAKPEDNDKLSPRRSHGFH